MRLPGYDNWLTHDFEHEHDRNQRLEALAERREVELRQDGAELEAAVADYADAHPHEWRTALVVAARSGRYQALDRCIERAIRQTAEQAAKEVEQARI